MDLDPDRPEVSDSRAKADRSVATLLSDLAGETIQLIRTELALLKAELQEKFSRAGQGAIARRTVRHGTGSEAGTKSLP